MPEAAPVKLNGTSVTIGGKAAFVEYVSSGQVVAQVPSDVGLGAQPVIVTTGAGSSVAQTVNVTLAQPGLLAPGAFSIGGKRYLGAVFSDGFTFALPPGAKIVEMQTQQGRLILRLRTQAGDEVDILDTDDGHLVARIK